MLRKTSPELLDALRHLENMYYLRDTVIPWMEANPDRVDLNQANSECGTYACLLGWFCVMRFGQTAKERIEALNTLNIDDYDFGGEGIMFNALFSFDWMSGTLSDRKHRLINEIIPAQEKRAEELQGVEL